jgi:glyoxylase-like metal-dependent hydrolase (beta-lactamase superfamily II)
MSRRSLLLLILATYASAVEVVTFTAEEQASGTNSHLLIGSTSAILIDAPMTRSEASRWEAGIRTALAGRTLAIILVTDSHPDHTGSLPFMQQAFPSARLLAQPAVIADLRRDGPVYHGRLRSRLGEEMAATIAIAGTARCGPPPA